MDDDNKCLTCGRYSGGGTLCLICQRAAVKRKIVPPVEAADPGPIDETDPAVKAVEAARRAVLKAREGK